MIKSRIKTQPMILEKTPTGIKGLDEITFGGLPKGRPTLVCGNAGCGKALLAMEFLVRGATQFDEPGVFMSFEETEKELITNLASLGFDLNDLVEHKKNFLDHVHVERSEIEITGFLTNLTAADTSLERTEIDISSLIDTWLMLRDIEFGGDRTRGMYILKSRGMRHSNQIREFLLTDHGVDLLNVYAGPEGVLTGSARLAQEAKEHAEQMVSQSEIQRKQLELDRRRKALEAQIALLKLEFEKDEAEALKVIAIEEAKSKRLVIDRKEMATYRKADAP